LTAYAYQIKSEYELSLEYYLKSIKIRKELFGEKHSIISDSYINVGIVYLETSEYDTAIAYYRKALEIRKNIFGEMHP
jgi:tetratricopeptide (TPR) repeat protein